MDYIEKIKKKMRRYCVYQERSVFQVKQKLEKNFLTQQQIKTILDDLIQENFLNDERFAVIYARGKFYQKKWGKLKIKQGLIQHHIPQEFIEKALLEIPPDDYQKTIRQLIIKKKNQINISSIDLDAKQKIIRYLLQKGFELEDIIKNLSFIKLSK